MPTISIILPVYNAESYVSTAVKSILEQTFEDFELIAIDDASSDASLDVLKSFNDPRVKVIANEINCGLSTTLNRGLELASGDFIARMDHDDIAVPGRLSEQLSYFDRNPSIDVCGSWVQTFGGSSRVLKYPLGNAEIEASLLFGNVICHPTVMFRRKIVLEHGFRYSPDFEYAEDYDFWTSMLGKVRYANIPQVLLNYRLHPEQMTSKSMHRHELAATRVFSRIVEKLGISASKEELSLHCAIGFHKKTEIINNISGVEQWLLRLHAANKRIRLFDENAFDRVLVKKWTESCAMCRRSGIPVLNRFWRSPLAALAGTSLRVTKYFDLVSRRRYC